MPINELIRTYLKNNNAENYEIRSVSIASNTQISDDEVIFITSCNQTNYKFRTFDDLYDDTQGERIVTCEKFIEIVQGHPKLNGYKVTILSKKEKEKIILKTSNCGDIIQVEKT